MTQKTLSRVIFLMIFSFASYAAIAVKNTVKAKSASISKEIKANTSTDNSAADKSIPVFPAPQPKVPHGKPSAPHMEELPHVHKFHKERVKKIKKHHGKYWLLSKIIIVLCHLSILVIAYLHATH